MQFEYIDENLNKVIENIDNVLSFKPYNVGNKRALFAIIKEDEGIYKKVQITKEQSKMSFPFEPLYWFYKGPGYLCLKKFMSLNNWMALNTTHLDGFKHKILDDHKIYKVGIFATFDDGSATFVIRESIKKFQKQEGVKPYIDLLKQYKKYSPQHNNYKIIDYHKINDDTFIIPELQKENEEQTKVKKITKDNNKTK